jgi:hypothetical protein
MGAGASSSGLSGSGRKSPPPLEAPLIYANDSYAYLLASSSSASNASSGAVGRRSGKKDNNSSAAQAFLTHEQKIGRASALLKLIFAVRTI